MLRVIPGERITAYTSTFPSRRYWYRHDTVTFNGVKLDGFIQVTRIHGHIRAITVYKDSCVIGRDPEWLACMNGITAV